MSLYYHKSKRITILTDYGLPTFLCISDKTRYDSSLGVVISFSRELCILGWSEKIKYLISFLASYTKLWTYEI